LKTSKHLFYGEINIFFAQKLKDFHDEFVETMLLCGVDKPGKSLEEIKMTKNPSFNMPYFKKLIGGILKFSPEIQISCEDELGNLLAECDFFHLNDRRQLDDIFLLQKIYHWDRSDLFCAQIWKLKATGISEINNFWRV